MSKGKLVKHMDLIQAVRKVNPKAADWIEHKAPKLDCFIEHESLAICFMWDDTPQGGDYWEKVWDKLPAAHQ